MSRTHPSLTKLRRLAKSLPESEEKETWGHPTFRTRDKIFASFGEHEGRPSIGCKSTVPEQAALLGDPQFFYPPYVGKQGWIGIYADEAEWDTVADLVEQSYRMIALKRNVKKLDELRS